MKRAIEVGYNNDYIEPVFDFKEKTSEYLPHTGDSTSLIFVIGYIIILFIIIYIVYRELEEESLAL